MATGLVDNWINIDQFGAIYPFVGMEGLMAFLGIGFWIVWHIIQIRKESIEFKDDMDKIREIGGVDKVLKEEVVREAGDLVGR